MNETRAVRTNLECADRRHPDSSSTACAWRVVRRVFAWSRLMRRVLPSAAWCGAATGTEAVCDFGNRDHRLLAVVHSFTIDVTDAQTPFEQFSNRSERGRTRHGTSQGVVSGERAPGRELQ